MGLSCIVSEINGDFSRISQICLILVYFAIPLTAFPLELGIDVSGPKTRMMGLPEGQNSFEIGLAVQTQYRRVTDRQTEGRTPHDGGLRYAERRAGKTRNNFLSRPKCNIPGGCASRILEI